MTGPRCSGTCAAALVAALALAGCRSGHPSAGASPAVAGSPGAQVVVRNTAFNPGTVTVTAGQAVTWAFDDAPVEHTVTADDGSFDSGAQSSGHFTHVFARPGRHPYHCRIHASMTGVVVVGS